MKKVTASADDDLARPCRKVFNMTNRDHIHKANDLALVVLAVIGLLLTVVL